MPPEPPTVSLEPRRAVRVPLGIEARLVLREGPRTCRIEEISYSGALLANAGPMRPGDSALLQAGPLDLLVEGVRRSGATIAVRFLEDPDTNDPDADEAVQQRASENRRFFRLLCDRGEGTR